MKSTVTASPWPGSDSVAVSPVSATSRASRGRASSPHASRPVHPVGGAQIEVQTEAVGT